MELKELDQVLNADEAREIAIGWQKWAGDQSLSYGELSHYQGYFQSLGMMFGLTDEFKENGIV